MKTSIIIPTCNRADQLSTCLNSVLSLDFASSEYEIIIVDNGSKDNTKDIVDEYFKKYSNHTIRYFYDDVPGLLTGRHRGAKEATGEVLCFLDDDVILTPKWLMAITDTMKNYPDVQLMTGPSLPKYEHEPPIWLEYFWDVVPYGGKYCGWLSLIDLGEEKLEIDPTFVWGLNYTIRKKIFEELGGFHPDNIPKSYQHFQGDGETGLSLKAKEKGYKSLYVPGAMVYHQIPSSRLTIEYFEKRAFYQGVCDSFTAIRMKNNLYINNSGKSTNFLKILIDLITKISRNAWNIFRKSKNDKSISSEIFLIKQRIAKKYKEGVVFHKDAFNKNKLVHQWVLQDNYFDYRLPKND